MQSRTFVFCVILIFDALAASSQIPVPVITEPKVSQLNPNAIISTHATNDQIYNPSASVIATMPRAGASSEENWQFVQEDIRRYELEKAERQKFSQNANSQFDALHFEYQLPFYDLPEKQSYFKALKYFRDVLEGREPINLEAAIFFVEHAYDPALKYEEFNQHLTKSANVIRLKMKEDNISADDNLGKILTIFQFMSDTISVYSKDAETTITTYPKTYDFEDFWGRTDYKKMFVSKLMREGSGQCHSLPLYFLLLCERIHADANLAFAPNHSFIKFQDKRGGWHNLELTNGMLASDHFMIESGYIKAEAIQNRIYLQPLTRQQLIVQCVNDLVLGYTKKFGYDFFVNLGAQLAIDHDPNSLTAHQINANYFMMLDRHIRHECQKKGIKKEVCLQNERAKTIYESAIGVNKFIERLGYTDMPQDVYEAWLKSAQNEANKQQHSKEVKVLGGMIEMK